MALRIGRVVLIIMLSIIGLAMIAATRPGDGQRDFESFYNSGRSVLNGTDPYDAPTAQTMLPPFTLPLLSLAARVEYWTMYRAWWAFSIALYVGLVLLLVRNYPDRRSPLLFAWSLAYAPLASTLAGGQIYVVLLALAVLAWLALGRGDHLAAGVALGVLVALKPNFGLWPTLLLLTGVYRPAVIAGGVAAALTLAPAAWYGPDILTRWLGVLRMLSDLMPGSYAEISTVGVWTRFGLHGLGVASAVALVIGAALWAWCRRPAPLDVSAVALVVALMAAPVTWPGYAVALLPVLLCHPWNLPMRIAAILFTIPFGFVLALGGGDVRHPATGVYGVALLLILAGQIFDRARATHPTITAKERARAVIGTTTSMTS